MTGMLLARLAERRDAGRPVRVGVIGAGTFATMTLSQLARLDGVVVAAVADRDPSRAAAAIARAGLSGRPLVTDDPVQVLRSGVEVLIEATGAPAAGVAHALSAIDHGCHVVMVSVEADVLAGPLLARRAREAGVVYSLAYGDQPALICELVDWARVSGLEVMCAGKGTKYLPGYHRATPATVWEHYGMSGQQVSAGGYNATMFTSFLDGTKSAIEMAAVCNATGLEPQPAGLAFPPCGAAGLAQVMIPRAEGGELERSGTVEVASSVARDGTPVDGDLRWGVFVTFAAGSDHVARWFRDYGLPTDESGRFASLHRPSHLIGLETPVSVLAAALLGAPTGSPGALRADVAAVAKRDLREGEVLDGEGGFTVYGALMGAADAAAGAAVPIGMAHGARLRRPVPAGGLVTFDDVVLASDVPALALAMRGRAT